MSAIAAPLRQAGLNALKAGKLQEAIGNLQQSARADPESFDTWSYLGAAYSRLSDFENARLSFGRAIQIKPDSARAWYNLGVAHEMAEDAASARTCFENALKHDAGHAAAQEALLRVTPKPLTMSELASVGGTVRLPGAHRETQGDSETGQATHQLTPQEMAQLATPDGSFHMPGAQTSEVGEEPKP